jgi:iron(III) transport system substrate-binding protein
MTTKHNRRTAMLAIGAMTLLGAGPAAAQTLSVADIAMLQGEDRAQALLEGARKEGALTIYMARSSMPRIIAAFEKKYSGIKVSGWRSGSEGILQRAVNEARSGRSEVDLIENNAPEMEAMHVEGLLQEVRTPYLADLIPQAVPPHRTWIGVSYDLFTAAYNTSKVKKENLPKSWQDLADPKWKGMLGVEAEDQTWFAYVLQQLGQDKGIELFRKIVATNGVSLRKGHSLLGQLVASGEVPLGLSLYGWAAPQLQDKGAPIENFGIGALIANIQGFGLMKKAPHPYTAMLFYDFMLTEGQQIFAQVHEPPTNTRYGAVRNSAITFIDPATALALNDERMKVFEDVFAKRAK